MAATDCNLFHLNDCFFAFSTISVILTILYNWYLAPIAGEANAVAA
jgi:hypothetical protein